MNIKSKFEKGQALVLIAIAFMGLLGMVALAVDGGMAFSDRRQGQNASDAAALYAARIYAQSLSAAHGASLNEVRTQVASNGYVHDGTNTVVTLTTQNAVMKCPSETNPISNGIDFTVTIKSTVKTAFAPVVGINSVTNTVSATARGCKSVWVPLYGGDAVVGLAPTGDSVYIQGNAGWDIYGGGVYANKNFNGKCGKPFVLHDGGINAVGTIDCPNGADTQTGLAQMPYPTNYTDTTNPIVAMQPPVVPACDNSGPDAGYTAAGRPGAFTSFTFSDGVYCVDNMDAFDGKDIVLSNAMLYVRDTAFDIKFAGGGGAGHGFAGTGRTTGPYAGLFMWVKMATPGHQIMDFRGNGYSGITGTILAPSATITCLGNSNNTSMHSQIIAYYVYTNGTNSFNVNYQGGENLRLVSPPSLALLK